MLGEQLVVDSRGVWRTQLLLFPKGPDLWGVSG